MPVPVSYMAVLVIWATTPLAILWSSESVDPVMAAWMRMGIAAALGLIILRLTRIELPWDRPALQTYAYAAIGVFGAMCCAYLAVRFIPSGLMSVLFGLAPIISGLMSQWILKDNAFTTLRWVACAVAVCGLLVIFSDDIALQPGSWPGILLLLLGATLFSLSGVMVKKVAVQIHPLAQTVGALLFSLPCFGITWYLMGAHLPVALFESRSIWAILYLALFGSLIGFVAYFHVLRHLPPSTVALITLITPVFALLLGFWLNNEPLTSTLMGGSLIVVSGLALFFFGHRLPGLRGKTVKNHGT